MESETIAGAPGAGPAARIPADEFRQALERALAEADADERIGPLLRAAGLRVRFAFPDAGVVLDVAAAEEGDRHLRWTFDDEPAWTPQLELEMNSDVANRFLLGEESLAIAIARRQARCRGSSRLALLFLPATRLISGSYRRVVEESFPALAGAGPSRH